jgi:C_GCAxxG_C_C family probable redox protein
MLASYCREYGLKHRTALRVAGAFGGGIGNTGETCGIITGSLMVIGLKYGKTRKNNKKASEKTYALAREFMNEFTARNSSVRCKDLIGCDVSTEEGMERAKELNVGQTICPKYIRDAVEILDDILNNR